MSKSETEISKMMAYLKGMEAQRAKEKEEADRVRKLEKEEADRVRKLEKEEEASKEKAREQARQLEKAEEAELRREERVAIVTDLKGVINEIKVEIKKELTLHSVRIRECVSGIGDVRQDVVELREDVRANAC